jgi:hypothetical protein
VSSSANCGLTSRAACVAWAPVAASVTVTTFALPLANNAGYWLIGTLQQQNQLDSPAGITTKTWPDGTDVDTPHLATVHHQTDEFLDTYTATEPAQSTGGQINLAGFFGSPILAAAS